MGMQTPRFVWMIEFTPRSIGTVKPLVMETKKLSQRGVKPNLEIFHDPRLLDNIFVLQAHVSGLPMLYGSLAMRYFAVTRSIPSTFSCNWMRLK